ncbi:MAG TPA: hypothetical protein VK609_06230 [Mucilaginibacter sp.]|nr:hypothetical protein [Mucilaginibacter sp.]
MQQEFSITQLNEWTANFNNNEALPFVTKSGLIELKELEDFILKIKEQQADSVRIYLLRFPLNDTPTAKATWDDGRIREGCNWHEGGKGFTQATIALVPTKNFRLDDEFIFSADDLEIENQITMLLPGINDKGTGLNPPSPKK